MTRRIGQPDRKDHTATCQSGCGEYQTLSRRNFLRFGGGLVAASVAPSWLPRVAYAAQEDTSRDILVSLFLRGGADALSLCAPYLEGNYHRSRPNLSIRPPDASGPRRAIDLDGQFGFSLAFEKLAELYSAGDLAVVHACGSKHPTRSHFDAMNFMETGETLQGTQTGWLGRHLMLSAPQSEQAVLRAVGIGFGLQRTLIGAPQALPLGEDPTLYGLHLESDQALRREALEEMYAAAGDVLSRPAAQTFRTLDLLRQINLPGYKPSGGAVYPDSDLGIALKSAAALINAEVGVEAIAVDAGGWDTHDDQGTSDGELYQLMLNLSESLAGFWRDLDGAGNRNVTLVLMSEFGRNLSENGSRGTDHGHGGLMMVLGSATNGGQVFADWPGLEREQLWDQQDLDVTIDYRDILGEILRDRLGAKDVQAVFGDPTYSPRDYGVVRA